MSRGVNKVMLLGYVGNEPELKRTPFGLPFISLDISTEEVWTDKRTGERRRETDWHKVLFFSKPAEICAEFAKKGSRVFICGRLKTRKYTDKNNIERIVVEILGDEW